ncbi:MAG: DUF839 domain-containing protein [Acidimicrobiia bacterium]|nr:DUF839 domain-containing protein [Acidimicrobiia bacterium]
MVGINRRSFIRGGAATAAGLAVAGPFRGYAAHAARGGATSHGYGPLGPVADLLDGVVRLDLPPGFQYRSFHQAGTVLNDGATLPGRHDGMFAFHRRGKIVLVRNHELNGNLGVPNSEVPLGDPAAGYDPLTKGGTVTVEVDNWGHTGRSHVSLSGTQMNCSGGPTPWGTWPTCEETVNGGDVGPDFTGTPNTGLRKHGYIFEVPTDGVAAARPIRAAGRFPHEAAVVTPHGRAVYLTEDNFAFPSGFYRYTPVRRDLPHRLVKRGRLDMLAVDGIDGAELYKGQAAGATFPVRWVRIFDPDPTFAPGTTNDQALVAVGDQGRAQGAALFSRLEGGFWSHGKVYFTSTQGGAASDAVTAGFGTGRGQVWAFTPGANVLELVFESPVSTTLDLPDNVTATRRGTLVLCEDGSGDNFLRGLTREGELFDIARNADAAQVGQEFAGATFSPDGHTLYVNVQSSSGYSVAIWGPWSQGGM